MVPKSVFCSVSEILLSSITSETVLLTAGIEFPISIVPGIKL